MMCFSISNFIFGISNYLAQAGIKSLDVLSLNFGNPYLTAYQLMYSTGTCFVIASKVLALLRLIKLGSKSRKVSPRKVGFIRVSLWSILVVHSVSSFVTAAVVFFDALSGSNETRFKQGTFVITLMCCIAFLSLAVMFIYGGVIRYAYSICKRCLINVPHVNHNSFFPAANATELLSQFRRRETIHELACVRHFVFQTSRRTAG